MFMAPHALQAQEEREGTARIYTTREERREAGQEHRLNRWLSASDLLMTHIRR